MTGAFSLFLLLTGVFFVCAETAVDEAVMRQTLPAYTIASKADLLNATRCRKELEDFRKGVDLRVLWSLKMLDASGEAKEGFIYGNNYWLGMRSQCTDIQNRSPFSIAEGELRNNSKYRNPADEFPPFELNYFAAYFSHNSTLQYHFKLRFEDVVTLGLCLPASCSTTELSVILKRIFDERALFIGHLYSADFKLLEVRDLRGDNNWLLSGRVIFMGCLLAFTVTMMIIGTVYDVFLHQRYLQEKKLVSYENANGTKRDPERNAEAKTTVPKVESRFGKIVTCFSIYSNTKLILDTRLGVDTVPPIHGLRFLGMLWIIMVHTIFYMRDFVDNKAVAWRKSEGFAIQVISNSQLSVDTYFCLSGFLVAYVFLKNKKVNEDQKTSVYGGNVGIFFMMVLRRFIRLTPAYMTMLLIVEVNFGWYSKVSTFYVTERPDVVCPKYWWRNLLYINNLFGRDMMCMSWSWYLSNDMQFFVIASFLLILSTTYFYTAVFILFSILLGSIISTGYIAYIYEYVPTMDDQFRLLDMLYDPPWTRIGPYIVGMITAYVIIKLNNKLHLKRRTVVMCWCLGSSCNLFVLFGLCKRHISVISAAFYVALSRTVWAVGLAWILVACLTQHGGIVNSILSFKGWIPMSRLTYCAYLLNPFLLLSAYSYGETAVHLDFLSNAMTFLGQFTNCYLCAYALSLMAETPYVLLMRLFMTPRSKTN